MKGGCKMALLLGEKINKKLNESKKTAYWLSKNHMFHFGHYIQF